MNATGVQRTIEQQYRIEAPVDAVWKALTDADELTRWFPLEARVDPGVGGAIWKSWAGHCEGGMPIEIWEPNKHLRLTWLTEVEGGPQEESASPSTSLAVDFHLEGEGGGTVLRLVHSGFTRDSVWDEMFDGIRRGWNFELRGLRHYLENHLGTPRQVVWAKARFQMSLADAWARLMGSDGLVRDGSLDGLKEGDRYSITTSSGDELQGSVLVLNPPQDFSATVDNMNRALLRVHIDNSCGSEPGTEVGVWFSCYGLPGAEVKALSDRCEALLQRLFPAAPGA